MISTREEVDAAVSWAEQAQEFPEEAASDMSDSAAIKTLTQTHAARYIHISLWAVVLLTVLSPLTVALWYASTMAAGVGRSYAERIFRNKLIGNDRKTTSRYALIAMTSCAFWAVAPVLCWHAPHALGKPVALILIVSGFMLALAQFRAAPRNAVIATAPYSAAFCYFLVTSMSTDYFIPLLAFGPLLVATIGYVLIFGLLTQREMTTASEERARLIKQLEKARFDAERASEAKSMFLANMSHEIRTPMNGVLGMAELIAQTELDSRQKLYADTIQKSGGALLAIINDILDFSKIEAGRMELDPIDFDLRTAVEDVVAMLSPRAQEKQLEIVLRFQPSLTPNLVGDAGRIRQVLTNLISNAVKFTETGYVLVSVMGEVLEGQANVRIEVADTGIGIEPDKLAKIFDSFSQADTSTTRKFGGTGLGLSISKRLVEAMDGRLGVASGVGDGSTFWVDISLPVSAVAPARVDDTSMIESRRILIIDDIDVNRQIASEQLEAWGFDTATAESGAKGLAALKSAKEQGKQFDLAIVDYFMPEMDGYTLAQKIRSDADVGATPILIFSSVDQAGDVKRFRDIGVDGYLLKPARAAVLLRTIKSILAPEAATDETVETKPAAAAAALSDDQKLRVLVAEDNEVNRLVIRHMIRANTNILTIVNNGREAVEAVSQAHDEFDIVLMDVSMPEMDGYEATQHIRKFEAENNQDRLPIICLTAHVLAADVDAALQSGMDDFLSKPVSQEKLERALEKWAAPRRAASIKLAN